MLALIRNNSPYTVIILFIFTLVLKLQAVLHPEAPALLPDHQLYNVLVEGLAAVLGGSRFAFTMLAVIMVFAQGLYLTAITVRHRLYPRPTYTPAFAWIVLSSLRPEFSYFSAPLLVNWLMIGALDILLKFTQPQHLRQHIFNTGFLVSVAALVQFSAVGYLLFFLLVLILLRPFHPGEWVVGLLGYFTPLYFFGALLFLADRFGLIRRWPQIGISLPSQLQHPAYLIGAVIGVVLLLSSGLFILSGQMGRYAVSVRRGWWAVIAFFVLSLVVSVFTPAAEGAAWICIMPALALVSAVPLNLEKSKRFSNFIFLFFLVFVIFCQLTVHK